MKRKRTWNLPKRLLQITALILCLCMLPWSALAAEGENSLNLERQGESSGQDTFDASEGRIALTHSSFDLNLNSMFDLPLYVEAYYPVTDSGGKNTEGCYTEPSGSGKVTWTSSDPGVATVDKEGRVHPVSEGTATITAVHADYEGQKATCEIRVYKDQECNTFLYVSPDGDDSNSGASDQPLQTIEGARDKIRAMETLPEGGVTVILKDGKYQVDETIVFTPEDSGKEGSPIVYKAENPGNAIVTGEQAITGWKKAGEVEGMADQALGNVYVADIEEGWRFHDLYVDGERQQVARSENTDTWRDWPRLTRNHFTMDPERGTKVVFGAGELDGLEGSQDIEIVLMPVVYWNSLPVVTEIDPESRTGYLQSRVPSNFHPDGFGYGYYNILNALKYLDEPGEWCVDSVNGKVYYWPLNEETIESAEIVAPKPYELMLLEGDEVEQNFEKVVQYITFEGISFQYTDRLPENQLPEDWIIRNAENPDAAIYLDGTQHIRILNCEIAHSGSYGVMINRYGQYNEILHNHIHDLGSGGVELVGYGVGTVDVNHHNFVMFNTFHDMGVAPYQHSAAVSVFGSGRNTFAFNYIGGAPYAGIYIAGTDENSVSSKNPNTRAAYDLFGDQSAQYQIRFEDLDALDETELDGNKEKGEYFSIGTLAAKYQHSNCNVAEYNILQDYSQSMDDGGGLYAWYSGLGNTYAHNILNEKLEGARVLVFSMYMDDRALGFTLYKNLCSGNFNSTSEKSFEPYKNRWLEIAHAKQPNVPAGYEEQLAKIKDTVNDERVGGFFLELDRDPEIIVPSNNATNVDVPTTLRWSSPNAASYTVEIAQDESFENVILKQKTTKDVLTTDVLDFNTTYYVRVTTREHLGGELTSEVVKFTTGSQKAPVTTPKNLQAVSAIDGVLLKWNDSGKNQVNVYRKTDTSEFELIAEKVSGIGYVDQDVDAGKTYYYQMALVNDGGVGPMSATLEAKAPTFETLFEDNFNGTEINEQWKEQDGNRPATTETSDGCWTPNVDWKEYYINSGSTEWTDYVVETDLTYNGPKPGQADFSSFGPIVRADTTNGHRRFYQMTVMSKTGELRLAAHRDGEWTHYDMLSGEPIENGKEYHLRMECIGGIIRIYVDDVLRFEVEILESEKISFTHGGAGIGIGMDDVSIDNFSVRAAVTPEEYPITVDENVTHGTVTVDPTQAVEGTEITVTVTPEQGYQLKAGSLKANGTEIVNGKFTMPAEAVTITAEFEEIPQTVDKTQLEQALTEAREKNQSAYTPESWAVFAEKLAAAEQVYRNEAATQNEVDQATDALRTAMAQLKPVEHVDKSELEAAVRTAKKLDEDDYTASSWRKFAAALEQAEQVLDDPDATQAEVNKATRSLKNAMDALKKKEEGTGRPDWNPGKPQTPVVPEKPEFPFTDVPVGAWYYDSVYYAWDENLIDGVTAYKYQPDGSLTVAQTIKLAAALHEKLNRGYVTLENGTANWYDTYVDYAVDNGIVESKYQSYTKAQMDAAITRNEFVHIFHGAMDSYKAINDVADNAIPDVKLTDVYADEIYDFYRAGILTGSDGAGTFNGKTTIKRSEVATILVRMYDESLRENINL